MGEGGVEVGQASRHGECVAKGEAFGSSLECNLYHFSFETLSIRQYATCTSYLNSKINCFLMTLLSALEKQIKRPMKTPLCQLKSAITILAEID